MKPIALFAFLLFISFCTAQNRGQDHNSSRSNKTASSISNGWNFGVNTGAAFSTKSNEATLFRGNSLATQFKGNYNFGTVGLGFSSGIIPGSINKTALNTFISERKYTTDQLQVNTSNPFNSYVMFGPSFQWGRQVMVGASLQGGFFVSDPGGVSIQQNGAARALYRFDGGSKNFFPGFNGNLHIAYPVSKTVRFTVNTDYLQSKSVIRIVDIQNGIDVAREQSRKLNLFTAGVGIVKTFNNNRVLPTVNKRTFSIGEPGVQLNSIISPRDAASGLPTGKRQHAPMVFVGEVTEEALENAGIVSTRDPASGQASGKRVLPTVNKREIILEDLEWQETIVSPRDAASGLPTGKRIVSPRDAASGLPTGKRQYSFITVDDNGGYNSTEIKSPRDAASGLATGKTYKPGQPVYGNLTATSCGEVTTKTTAPDGSVEEITFACPEDAANYKLKVDGLMGPRMSTNLTTAKQTQGATFGEKVNAGLHAAGSAVAHGAARNIIAGRVINSQQPNNNGIITNKTSLSGGGAAAASYAATGKMATVNFYTREAGSGQASGKRSRDKGTGMATGRRQYQPLFFEGGGSNSNSDVASISNPLYKENNNSGVNPLYEGNKTATAADNDCDGVSGITVQLIDANNLLVATTATGNCGEFFFANVPDNIYTVKLSGSLAAQKTYQVTVNITADIAGQLKAAADFWSLEIITDTGSAEKAAMLIKTKTKSNQSNDRLINTSRSNIKQLAVTTGDVDGDGAAELLVGGAIPGGNIVSAALKPGGPIGGIIVKGGKNPGGQMRTTTTNGYGEFEFTDWQPGSYTITAQTSYIISDETLLMIGQNAIAENINTTESNLKDIPPTINKTTTPKQTQGATFGEKVKAPEGNDNAPTTKAQNNNTVRSNRGNYSSILIEADMDGDGTYETDLTTSYTDAITIATDGSVNNTPVQKAGISTSRSNIRNRSAVQTKGTNLLEATGILQINNQNVPVKIIYQPASKKVVEKATSGLKDTLKTQV